MRRIFVPLMASLLSCSAVFAFWPEATDSSLEIGVGYRQDRLQWKTDSHRDSYCEENSPFAFSNDVKWRNLNIWQIQAKGEYVTCDNLYLRGNASYGWITSGKLRDNSNFGPDYNEFEFTQLRRNSNKARGNVYDARIAVGYQFKMCEDSFAVSPLIGYSWHGQHIRHHNNDDDSSYNCGSFNDYDYNDHSSRDRNRFHTRWNGPFIGFDFDYRFGCGCEADWEVFGTYEFHWAEYHASGRWFRNSKCFDSLRQHSRNAYGSIFDIGVKWDFCECWSVALQGEFQWFWADKAHDSVKFGERKFADVEHVCYLKSRLRDIRWESAGVTLLLGMEF